MRISNYDSNYINPSNNRSIELFTFIKVQPHEMINNPSLNNVKNNILDIRKSYSLCVEE